MDFPDLEWSDTPADRVAYARDLWPRHHLRVRGGKPFVSRPRRIVWPKTTEDVSAIVRWAHEHRVPIVPFGAGSGVCAGVLPTSEAVIIDMKRMKAVRRLDREASVVDVEAGLLGIHFEEWLGREGFTLGHFPSSILCSTVGGWVAGRSAGQNSGYYGKIEDMVASIECVTGTGEIVKLERRTEGPDLLPLMIGSEGIFGVITSMELRIHPKPTVRSYAAWSFPSTEDGWNAMRVAFQEGLRPAVCRLYDPFDAMIAKRGAVRREKHGPRAPGAGERALRALLRQPELFNDILDNRFSAKALGGAMVVTVFEGQGDRIADDCERMRALMAKLGGAYEGEGPAQRWFKHRYSISYRQSPVLASGLFLDTMEVAATWSDLPRLFDNVRHALGKEAFVMAHLSHAYPDGCCIYFSFAGRGIQEGSETWDDACERVYERTWERALRAAAESGGTIAHHHGVGRSKAPMLRAESGYGVDVVRALKRAFDPRGILNPGAIIPEEAVGQGDIHPHAIVSAP